MNFDINKSIEILERTPSVLESMLSNLSTDWTKSNEGGETWSPFDVVGHMLMGERVDWIERMQIILSETGNKEFRPFDRFAQFEYSKTKSLKDLLFEFHELRVKNIAELRSNEFTEKKLLREGIHPSFVKVTLKQLLSTWVVHDLNHIAQINRVMAKQYTDEVGPWKEYLRILK